MNRKAILVEASNVLGQTDLPGARVDIINWKEFLLSPQGGSWAEAEIKTLHKPYSSDLEGELRVSEDTYCFVAFSGHGCDGVIVLNDILDSYPVAKLRPSSKKSTVVVDSCRGLAAATRYAYTARAANEAALRGLVLEAKSSGQMQFSQGSKSYTSQALFFLALQQCQVGAVQMLACASGQGASEDPHAGGYYTSLLMDAVQQWISGVSRANVMSTKEAHDYAVGKLPPQQTPEYTPSNIVFPFGIRT